jgi:hypothetical protein
MLVAAKVCRYGAANGTNTTNGAPPHHHWTSHVVNEMAGDILQICWPLASYECQTTMTHAALGQPSALARTSFPVACHHPQLVALHWSKKVQINLIALGNALVLIRATHMAQSIGK